MPDRSLRTCVFLSRRPTLKWLNSYQWSVVIAVCYIDLQDHLKEGTGRVCHWLQQIEFGQRKYQKNSRHGPRVCLVIYYFYRWIIFVKIKHSSRESIDAYVCLSLILVQLGLECQNFPARKRVINYSPRGSLKLLQMVYLSCISISVSWTTVH